MANYCDVVFNLPVNQVYTYCCKDFPDCTVGKRVRAPLRSRRLTGFVIALRDKVPSLPAELKSINKVIDKEEVFASATLKLAQWLSDVYICSLGEALAMLVPGAKKEVESRGSSGFHDETEYALTELTLEQQEALKRLAETKSAYFYLFGVTGSGKTHVFLERAKRVFQEGKGIIYLVPEIALTEQVISAIKTTFGQLLKPAQLAVLHSGLSPSKRLREWLRIKRGEARVVVGVRSAVFAPVSNLGLIIIDEEHETSYKAGSTPRYHARQVAMYRVKEEKAMLLMGSATPSLEAYALFKSGKLDSLRLKQRPRSLSLPQIEIVDLNQTPGPLTAKLIQEIADCKKADGQTILFLNRRGFAYFYRCNTCGHELQCLHCSVGLTYHKQRDLFICHYCGYRLKPPSACPACGSLDTVCLGFGTERIEEDLRRIFHHYRIARLDTDSVRKKSELSSILSAFKQGDIDILVGTQMVAKGLNIRRLRLVGVIYADAGLLLPDFRAAERTFSLLVQVSGRAGRYSEPGKVIIQTFRPGHDAVRLAAEMQLEEFYERELALRQELGFPPFSRLIRLVFRGRCKEKTKAASESCLTILSSLNKDLAERQVDILGPAECPLALIAHNYRFQLILRSPSLRLGLALVKGLGKIFKPPLGVYLEVDVDPLSLL